MKNENKSSAESLRQKAEEFLRNKKPIANTLKTWMPEPEALRIIHELEVHQIELEMQNDELIEANVRAVKEAERYAELYDFAPSGYFTLSRDGNIIELNLNGANMLGKERSHLKNRQFALFVSRDTRPVFNLFLEKAFQSKIQETCEIKLVTNGKLPMYVLLTGNVAENQEQCNVVMVDITKLKLAETALVTNNLRLELALKSGNMAWWEMDLITGAVTFEKSKAEMLGFAPEKFKHYMDFVSLVHPEDTKRIMMAMQRHLDGLVDKYEIEYRILTKSGEYCWFYDIGSVSVKDATGKTLLTSGLAININERKLAETELRNRKIRLLTLLQTIPDLIWLKDTEGVYLSCNSMFERFFGATENEIIGKTDYDFVSKELADFFREHDRAAMAAGEPTINEEWVTFATDEQHKFLETIKMPMLDATGTIIGVLGVGRDITRRKQTEIKLLESEEKFKLIYEGSNDAIMLLDKNGFFDCNMKTLEIFRINNKEEFIGLHPSKISPPTQPDGRISLEAADEKINFAYQHGMNQFDWIHRRSDGEDFPAVVQLSAFNLRGERVLQSTVRDFTDTERELISANTALDFQNQEKEKRTAELIIANNELAFLNREKEKQAAELILVNNALHFEIMEKENQAAELIVAKEKAEESNHLKSAFLATMNHELRTPLNHILGFSEIINSSAEDDDIKEWANIIVESGTGLLNIIEDIFDLALAEQGQIKIRKQSFKGIDIFLENRKALDEIIVNAGKENEIKLVYKPDSTLLQTFLIADRSKINQVLINLFKNASKFTSKGIIEFGFYQKDENEIVFYVKDTGVGIQADKLDVIFEFFRQLDDSNTRYYGGVGIGLAISKRIAEAMNARIVVESEVGKGTTFFLHVPVEITSLVFPTHESDDDVTLPDLTGKTILIAEDDAISRRLVKMLLETTHANIIEAENGQEAIEKMVEFQDIDLILMDLKMPVLDGYKATTQIKAIWPDIKIIALTVYSIVKEKKLALSAGCDDIIIKPIDKRILFAKLKQFCNS